MRSNDLPSQGSYLSNRIMSKIEEEVEVPSGNQSDSEEEITSVLRHYYSNYKNLNNLIIKDQPITDGYINLAILKKKVVEENEKKLREVRGREEGSRDKIGKLREERLETYESMHEEKEAIEIDKLFEKRENKEIKKLAICGRAGIGKSTLCQYISVRWSEGSLWSYRYKAVIWLPLRKIASELKNRQEDISLKEVIREHCIGGRERYKPSVEAIDNFIGNFSDILFILDGYDEIAPIVENSENREGEKIRRILKEILTDVNSRVIVTSRPTSRIRQIGGVPINIDEELENIGFTSENMKSYISKFMPSNKSGEIIRFLEGNKGIWGIAHIPINLELICYAWEDLSREKNYTMSKLYKEISSKLLRRYLTKGKNKEFLSEEAEEIALDEWEECEEIVSKLEELAIEGMKRNEIVIGKEIVTRVLGRNTKEVLKTGIIKNIGEDVHFLHLTFQEYFAARYIARSIEEVGSDRYKKAVELIREHKYTPNYEVMWWYVAGVLYDRCKEAGNYSALVRFWHFVEKKPRELVGVRHVNLQIRCLEECEVDERVEIHKIIYENILASDSINKAVINVLSISPIMIERLKTLLKREDNNEFKYLYILSHIELENFTENDIKDIFDKLNAFINNNQNKLDTKDRAVECMFSIARTKPSAIKLLKNQLVQLLEQDKEELLKELILTNIINLLRLTKQDEVLENIYQELLPEIVKTLLNPEFEKKTLKEFLLKISEINRDKLLENVESILERISQNDSKIALLAILVNIKDINPNKKKELNNEIKKIKRQENENNRLASIVSQNNIISTAKAFPLVIGGIFVSKTILSGMVVNVPLLLRAQLNKKNIISINPFLTGILSNYFLKIFIQEDRGLYLENDDNWLVSIIKTLSYRSYINVFSSMTGSIIDLNYNSIGTRNLIGSFKSFLRAGFDDPIFITKLLIRPTISYLLKEIKEIKIADPIFNFSYKFFTSTAIINPIELVQKHHESFISHVLKTQFSSQDIKVGSSLVVELLVDYLCERIIFEISEDISHGMAEIFYEALYGDTYYYSRYDDHIVQNLIYSIIYTLSYRGINQGLSAGIEAFSKSIFDLASTDRIKPLGLAKMPYEVIKSSFKAGTEDSRKILSLIWKLSKNSSKHFGQKLREDGPFALKVLGGGVVIIFGFYLLSQYYLANKKLKDKLDNILNSAREGRLTDDELKVSLEYVLTQLSNKSLTEDAENCLELLINSPINSSNLREMINLLYDRLDSNNTHIKIIISNNIISKIQKDKKDRLNKLIKIFISGLISKDIKNYYKHKSGRNINELSQLGFEEEIINELIKLKPNQLQSLTEYINIALLLKCYSQRKEDELFIEDLYKITLKQEISLFLVNNQLIIYFLNGYTKLIDLTEPKKRILLENLQNQVNGRNLKQVYDCYLKRGILGFRKELGIIKKTELHKAAERGDLERVKSILAQGKIDINDQSNRYRETPLMLAAQNGYWEVVRFLVRSGADINCYNLPNSGDCKNVIGILFNINEKHDTWKEKYESIEKLLSSRGASSRRNNSTHVMGEERKRKFLEAIASDSRRQIAEFLENDRDINHALDEEGSTPLIHAVKEKASFDIIKVLIERGALPSQTNKAGQRAVDICEKYIQELNNPFNKENVKKALVYLLRERKPISEVRLNRSLEKLTTIFLSGNKDEKTFEKELDKEASKIAGYKSIKEDFSNRELKDLYRLHLGNIISMEQEHRGRISTDGFNSADKLLSMRLYLYLELLVKIESGERFKGIESNRLKKEILTILETLHNERIRFIMDSDNEIARELRAAQAENILSQIRELKVGEEYHCHSGYYEALTSNAHSLYVGFNRIEEDKLIIRIDNRWIKNGRTDGELHGKSPWLQRGEDNIPKIKPYLVAIVSFSNHRDIEKLKEYIAKILLAVSKPLNDAELSISYIYQSGFRSLVNSSEMAAITARWPYQERQIDGNGNCTMSSHNMGVSVRNGVQFFEGLLNYERREVWQESGSEVEPLENKDREQGIGLRGEEEGIEYQSGGLMEIKTDTRRLYEEAAESLGRYVAQERSRSSLRQDLGKKESGCYLS